MDLGTFRGIVTLVALVAFIGLVIWAYGKRRHADFERAARLPLEDDAPAEPTREDVK